MALTWHKGGKNHPQRTLSKDWTEDSKRVKLAFFFLSELLSHFYHMLASLQKLVCTQSVRDCEIKFLELPALLLKPKTSTCFLCSIAGAGQVAWRGAGWQRAADVGRRTKDAVQDLPGGLPQEHQGRKGGAGLRIVIFFYVYICLELYFPYICCWLLIILSARVKTKWCHVRV